MDSGPASEVLPDGFCADDSYPDTVVRIRDLAGELNALSRGQTELFLRSTVGDLELVTLTASSPPPTLGQILPMLQCLDLEIVDRRSRALIRADGLQCHVVVIGLVSAEGGAGSASVHLRMADALRAMWVGDTDVDDFNKLVTHTGLTWREVTILRAYARYLRQLGQPYSVRFTAATLLANPTIAVEFVELFRATVGEVSSDRERTESLRDHIITEIQQVPQLDADRVLRALLTVISATLRTNAGGATVPSAAHALALKIAPQQIPFAPLPRPQFEVYVLAPDVEGVHVRFGRVARGGLRWSDRSEDLRTEVLGLAATQQAKNAVIVPVGAKGGYVLRRTFKDDADRAAAGRKCYELFVSALLDVTDNVGTIDSSGFRQSGHGVNAAFADPYLVVAADKGTSAFSDLANDIAQNREFWLGDAFASGGSAGYDHKHMGITARGAWMSARRHLSEIGVDPDKTDFTVVGIGDMSGDVFGNGMLLSPHTRLVAAFDHRDIFIDPDPDPTVSYAERQRLFDMPRSRWADYDPRLISAGGGVWSRTAKAVALSAEVRAALGIAQNVPDMAPDDLIKAILRSPVNMLWNGGVGTYVKAAGEGHEAVGDKANDAVRIDASELRVEAIVEGGNLGLTQAARIEFARAGGRINTDALDNSAGVDCSDHEVNIKIALSQLTASGQLPAEERGRILRDLEAEVAEQVLANNVDHNVVLGVSRRSAVALNDVHARQVADLDERGDLDRRLARLPSAEEFAAMTHTGRGLLSPDLATLMAHTKLAMKRELLDDPALDEPEFRDYFVDYFPKPLRSQIAADGLNHPLRREITVTQLVNHVVAVAGFSFVHRLHEQTGAGTLDAVRAFWIVNELFDLNSIRGLIDRADLDVSTADEIRLRTRLLVDRCAAALVGRRCLDVRTHVDRLRPPLHRITAIVQEMKLPCAEWEDDELYTQLIAGAPAQRELAQWIRVARLGPELLDAAAIAASSARDVDDIAAVFFDIHRRLRISALSDAVNRIKLTGTRSHFLARLALSSELADIPRAVTHSLLQSTTPMDGADLAATHAALFARIGQSTTEVLESAEPDVEALLVVLHQLKNLAAAAAS
ncbi:NAD-glutamate dehydrogenase domain-containing protein [Mycolicibacterium sp. YH-1]|uniref:NAD-glutamate dehydrogenase domain-containing protein n=1 Tax=Mycolicibacterium sp. YH-1 TaxID=2908837 RepID=UPI001F4C1239|nr:NAD-glutamate dehydrogenase domain-containing protein [Mycolicibacterium sp. YH-1]UNB50819.1 NAD-glutamate dehydrogenase [Mycolicibacterium sp. YH-1]